MADDGQLSLWVMVGTAIGGIATGIGSILGIKRVRQKNGEADVSGIDEIKKQLATLQSSIAQSVVSQDTMNRIDSSLAGLYERMAALEKSVYRLEGFEAGRRSREHERGDG